MHSTRELINYLESIGLEVNTSTKARGHQGFYVRNRIDVSKNVNEDRIIPVLLHEFAHYIHSCLESGMEKNGGSLEVIFDDDNSSFYVDELLAVTNFVDKNSKFEKLRSHQDLIKEKIKEYELIIKNKYPNFLRTKKFNEFNKYIKGSKARYLLKYDRVKLVLGRGKYETLTLDNLEKDFSDMPKEFAAYIRLQSCRKRQGRISSRINRLKKYYAKPTELFARFVEGLNIDNIKIKEIAPNSYKRFFELLDAGYYRELQNVKELLQM